ncbi:hypothetical protein ABEX78_22595 [Priestia megaterium]
MSFILEYKWLILILFEIFSWGITFLILYSRYVLKSGQLTILFIVLEFITGWLPDLIIIPLTIIKTQRVSIMDMVFITFIVYAATLGKKYIKWIDKKINQKIEPVLRWLEGRRKKQEFILQMKKIRGLI